MYDDDTIVAISTAIGTGALSIVRISGADALPIALKITKKNKLLPRVATLCKAYDTFGDMIDAPLVIYFENPKSFTGEDIVEFQCHGGVALTNMLLDTALHYGARLANTGEFSKRACLNGKMDLTQAYAISKLIEAKSEDGVKLLARQLKGELRDFIEEIRKDLLFILAYVEVSIDYAEEDLPRDIFLAIENKIETIQIKLYGALSSSKRREGMIDGFKVAIVGKPNVGKSSLLNRLLNFDRAIVSSIAGTTRDTIEENIKIGTHIIKIVDTAGIRDTDEIIESIGIVKSIQAINECDIAIALFDNSSQFDDEDQKIIDILADSDKVKIFALNKCDLENKFDKTKLKTIDVELNIEEGSRSSVDGLIQNLKNILNSNTASTDGIAFISKMQIISVEDCLRHIKNSELSLKNGELEIFSYHITEALEDISKITRPYEHKEMLDVMFGEFCLGK